MSNDTLSTAAHTSDTPQVLLEHHLKQLRLPTMLREYDHIARQCAVEQVDYQRYLLRIDVYKRQAGTCSLSHVISARRKGSPHANHHPDSTRRHS